MKVTACFVPPWETQLGHGTYATLLLYVVKSVREPDTCGAAFWKVRLRCRAHTLRVSLEHTCREEDLELEETVAEEAEEEEPWEYDAEALKHWEQFVKKSKVTQVRLLINAKAQSLSNTSTGCQQLGWQIGDLR